MEYDVRNLTSPAGGVSQTASRGHSRCCCLFKSAKSWIKTGHSWLQSLSTRLLRHWQHQPTTSPSIITFPPLLVLVLFASTVLRIAESCSSRSTPKPRPPSPTLRPNITFQTYDCPEAYAKWYCLNGATCFSVRIGASILYNCECADGYMGQRCEFKDLDGSYLPNRERVMIETASIAGGVTLAVIIIVGITIFACTYFRRWKKVKRVTLTLTQEDLDRRPFNTRTCSRTPTIVKLDPESGRGSTYHSPDAAVHGAEIGRSRNGAT